MMLNGIPLIVSDLALEKTAVRNFPESRHRSARIHKKLVKRHGGEYRMKPCMFKTPQGYLCHPAIFPELKRAIAAQQ